MFGWFRNLTKKSTIVDNSLLLDEPDYGELPQALEAEVVEVSASSPALAPAQPAAPARPAAPEPAAAQPKVEAPTAPVEAADEARPEPVPSASAPLAEVAEPASAIEEPIAAEPAALDPTTADAEAEAIFDGIVPAPSVRPAMPLSAHPNFAGLDLAVWEPTAPRLLQPEAALTPEAQQELLKLFDDLFGPSGRYRLEWRTDRRRGDDAMFAEIMTADLVRRVQNTIADVAELERIEPLKMITAAPQEDEELPRAS
ncbi:hypothetical protein EG850_02535 [Gulosibacter macacae]|uniref:Uncharacterized protein n=1 Tax=Gulosibacter macacae TaxID=2488791 RepID=A0A3P3W332_9MICO|nr:hypothetical protein [Gulosibacter macacae]RRJ88336.1 hypothetical protein EG850_02535 [Gulosibacter macacae]